MLAGLRQMLTSPVTGPVATAVALVLALVLGFSTSSWQAERERYEARIAALSGASDRAQASLRTQLAACHASGAARRLTEAEYAARRATAGGARQLLEQQPAGIDACARMESADQAVLSNLKR